MDEKLETKSQISSDTLDKDKMLVTRDILQPSRIAVNVYYLLDDLMTQVELMSVSLFILRSAFNSIIKGVNFMLLSTLQDI